MNELASDIITFSNLIENSIDAADKEICIITIDMKLNENFHFSISDNGKGIPTDLLFEIGRKGITSGKVNGNGLGLAYCKSLIEAVGGNISIESQVSMGTIVEIKIPVT